MYTIEIHQHRLAAWAASTAASASSLYRFKVSRGVSILETAGFKPDFILSDSCLSPDAMDQQHEQWRNAVIDASGELNFSHGVAAKLINTYLKTRFIVAGTEFDPLVAALHPPVDRLLLGELASQNIGGLKVFWRKYQQKGWSKFDSIDYQNVIDNIRHCLAGQPLWMIEQYWCGFQGEAAIPELEEGFGKGELWEPSSKPGVLSSSNKWHQAKPRKSSTPIQVAYGGGLVTIPAGDTYYIDLQERVIIGFHGTYNPPSGMGEESLI